MSTIEAFIGGNLGYCMSRLGGGVVLSVFSRLFRIYQEKLEAAKAQLGNTVMSAVFFWRFVALLRIFVGPIVGITKMPYS